MILIISRSRTAVPSVFLSVVINSRQSRRIEDCFNVVGLEDFPLNPKSYKRILISAQNLKFLTDQDKELSKGIRNTTFSGKSITTSTKHNTNQERFQIIRITIGYHFNYKTEAFSENNGRIRLDRCALFIQSG